MSLSNLARLSVFRLFLMAALAVPLSAISPPTFAQQQVWIQLEARNSLRGMRERAQFYAARFPDTRAFETPGGWYVIVIGPIEQAEANRLLVRLKSNRSIPGDAFIADGRKYLTQLWPVAATATRAVEAPAPPSVQAASERGAPIPDPDLADTKRLERSWDRERKKLVQRYLVWTRDYDSAIDGDFGPATRKAIRSFQTREEFQATGYLTEAQLTLLQQHFEDATARLGLEELRNLDAGIALSYPADLVEFDRFEPPFVFYRPTPGSNIRMVLISQKGGRALLGGLYDIMAGLDFVPPEGYRRKRDDWFVLSGRDKDLVSYTYVRHSGGALKGFSLIWTPKEDLEMQTLATVMYNSFSPLDDYVLDENLGSEAVAEDAPDLSEGIETAAPVRAASGFFINEDGVILTSASNVDGCARLTFEGGQELSLRARSPDGGVAILEPPAGFRPKSFALFSDQPARLGDEITIAGFSYPEVMDIAALNFGTLTDINGPAGAETSFRVSAFLESGDTGGPVLDNRGAVLGMQLPRPDVSAGLPDYVNFALKPGPMMALLARHDIKFGRATSVAPAAPEDIAFMAGDFTVKIACW